MSSDATPDLEAVFRPRSVCLVGVSADPHKLNGLPLDRLTRHGFAGAIHLVNPKYSDIRGRPCLPDVDSLPGPVDVALVMVPAAQVPPTIEALGHKGTRAAVVLSSGFEETQDGGRLADALREAAEKSGVTVVGPNCEGIWSVRARTVLTFGSAAKRNHIVHAPIAIVSQSGSVAGAVARQIQDSGPGCSYVVSVGNETMVTILDHLDYLIRQDDVKIVLMFVEALRDGERLAAIAERAHRRGISLVMLKSGNSEMATAATSSHTGKIASAYGIYADLLNEFGILQVASLNELIEAGEVLETLRPLKAPVGPGAGIAVFSLPGGTRAMTIDAADTLGVPLAVFSEATVQALENRLPRFGYARNPTDVTGAVLSDPTLLKETLGLVCADPNSQAVVVQLANRGPEDAHHHRLLFRELASSHELPFVVSFLGDRLPAWERQEFARDGIVLASDPHDAVRYLSYAFGAQRAHATADAAGATEPTLSSLPSSADWARWMSLLQEFGFRTAKWHIVNPEEACACAGLRLPVAVKVLPVDCGHKTEMGLVRLSVQSWGAVEQSVAEIRAQLGRDAPVLVQEMVPPGREVLVAAIDDPDFGPVLVIGAGGVLIEVLSETGYVSLPTTPSLVRRRVEDMKLGRLLRRFRGSHESDIGALCGAAAAFGNAIAALPKVHRPRIVELNPVIVQHRGQGAIAVDVFVE